MQRNVLPILLYHYKRVFFIVFLASVPTLTVPSPLSFEVDRDTFLKTSLIKLHDLGYSYPGAINKDFDPLINEYNNANKYKLVQGVENEKKSDLSQISELTSNIPDSTHNQGADDSIRHIRNVVPKGSLKVHSYQELGFTPSESYPLLSQTLFSNQFNKSYAENKYTNNRLADDFLLNSLDNIRFIQQKVTKGGILNIPKENDTLLERLNFHSRLLNLLTENMNQIYEMLNETFDYNISTNSNESLDVITVNNIELSEQTTKDNVPELKNPKIDYDYNFFEMEKDNSSPPGVPIIFLITPTLQKPQQRADLIRLSQTLMLVPTCHWILIEDGNETRSELTNLLRRSGLSFTHLHAKTPPKIKDVLKIQPYRPRGVAQRNAGLTWLRTFAQEITLFTNQTLQQKMETDPNIVSFLSKDDKIYRQLLNQLIALYKQKFNILKESLSLTLNNGPLLNASSNPSLNETITPINSISRHVLYGMFDRALKQWLNVSKTNNFGYVYFADDDNTYDLALFDEMRKIKRVGIWPVGLVGGLYVEKPFLHKRTGQVIGFDVIFNPTRAFALDMAAFAINLELILGKPQAEFSVETCVGCVETSLLKHLITSKELEPLADNCTKVYVWHTNTRTPELQYEKYYQKIYGKPSNLGIVV